MLTIIFGNKMKSYENECVDGCCYVFFLIGFDGRFLLCSVWLMTSPGQKGQLQIVMLVCLSRYGLGPLICLIVH